MECRFELQIRCGFGMGNWRCVWHSPHMPVANLLRNWKGLLPFWKLSDNEIIARARKNLAWSRRSRLLLLCVMLVMGALAVSAGSVFFDWVIKGLEDSGGHWRWFYMGVSTGMTAVVILMAVAQAAVYLLVLIGVSFFDQRDRLLVRYHDELHAKRV